MFPQNKKIFMPTDHNIYQETGGQTTDKNSELHK